MRFVGLVLSAVFCAMPALARCDSGTTYSAVDHTVQTIYHSPQRPGFTCWVSAWSMPDQSIWTCFTQATGPVEGRPKTAAELRHKLSWPPGGNEAYDMNGLKMENVYLRSADGGKTWEKASADTFRSPINSMGGIGTVGLLNGTVLREGLGFYLPYDKSVEPTGFIQISTDGTKSWSQPLSLLDPQKYFTWPVRMRPLRDGRIVAVGGLIRVPARNDLTRNDFGARLEPLLAVSNDGGQSWKGPIDVLPGNAPDDWRASEECDVAELSNGDLLLVVRSNDSRNSRRQAVLKKEGEIWRTAQPQPSPLASGGHPDLLSTKEGIVLCFAEGERQAWTDDGGKTWHPLQLRMGGYYPRSIQKQNGEIVVISHVGADDAYGTVDQSIVMDSFRLQPTRE